MRTTIKIQKRVVSKKTAKEKRYIYTATIPEQLLKILGWKEGTELDPFVKAINTLVFKKV